jgi:hypothetical protein
MLPLFGILTPPTGPSTPSDEAPLKKSFFGGPVRARPPNELKEPSPVAPPSDELLEDREARSAVVPL